MNKYRYLLGCVLFWAASAVQAQGHFLFGFHGSVTFRHLDFPDVITTAPVSGPTYWD